MLVVFVLVLLAAVFFPGSVMILLVLNMGFGLVLSILHLYAALFPRFVLRQDTEKPDAFVSILVPAYNEPPAVLMQTIEAMTELEYQNFEVIVIDNNTKDPAVWKPVEAFMKTLDSRFRFFHVEQLEGFKAGALNHILKEVNPRSEYIAVVDADYVVKPDFVGASLSYFTEDNIGLVQFPQQYRNCTAENQPIADEYRHFFKVYMNMANHLNCVPSTGTVSVYRREVLNKIGGFNEGALTEDADASLRIYRAGYRGVYVDRTIGYGLMPYDIEAYRKQKRRWAVGNIQSIKTLFTMRGKIKFWSWVGFLSHLTVWNNLNFLPFAVLAAYVVVLLPLVPTTLLHTQLLQIASLSIFVTLASRFVVFLIALRNQKKPISRAWKAFVVHMGMSFLYSQALGAFWFQLESKFERTNKFILQKMPSLLKNTYREFFLGLWLLIGFVEALAFGGGPLAVAAFVVSSGALFSIYFVHWRIRPTKEYSQKMLADLEEKYQDYLLPSTSV